MLRLVLVRHAEAAPHAPQGDRERPLTARGHADAARMGPYFRASGIIPDLALVSPALRARGTLDAILRELPGETFPWAAQASLYNARAGELHELVSRTGTSVETLLVVGHNPGLGEFAAGLVGGGSGFPRHFPAPSLAVVRFCCRTWSEACAGGGTAEHFLSFSSLPGDELFCSHKSL
jgi:phosphohistidine phosphatase